PGPARARGVAARPGRSPPFAPAPDPRRLGAGAQAAPDRRRRARPRGVGDERLGASRAACFVAEGDPQHGSRDGVEPPMIAALLVLLAQAAPPRVLTLQEAERVAQERQPQLR